MAELQQTHQRMVTVKKASLALTVFVAFSMTLSHAFADCYDKCWDKYQTCRDRCGPRDTGSSCFKKCEVRKDRCYDKCNDGRKDESKTTKQSFGNDDTYHYCYKYHDEIVAKYGNRYNRALNNKRYCSAISNLEFAISKFDNPTRECKRLAGWMMVFEAKKQQYREIIKELKPRCPKYSEGASTTTGDGLTVEKSSEGITITQ